MLLWRCIQKDLVEYLEVYSSLQNTSVNLRIKKLKSKSQLPNSLLFP